MTESVVWSETEPKPRYDWVAIAEALEKEPMRWATIFENDRTSVVVAVSQGRIARVSKAMGFETRTSNNKRNHPRTCTLQMRFNPDKVNELTAALVKARAKKGRR